MDDEVASLGLAVNSAPVEQATNRLGKLVTAAGAAEVSAGGLTRAWGGFAAQMAGIVSVGALTAKFVEVNRAFDVLNAGLITATGSAENAKVAFGALQQFAIETPYSLRESTDAFTKLVNFGLNPSERALRSYGNTASSMGRSLSDMIDAVATASVNNFRRLRGFGILAAQQGDQVTFTFRGVTTTVKKNAKEIENYLIKLGENNFADAMANRMKTLDGALSNLNDAWDLFWRGVGDTGARNELTSIVLKATDALTEMKAMLDSGEMAADVKALSAAWGGWGRDVHQAIEDVRNYWNSSMDEVGEKGESTVHWIVRAFKELPENLRAIIEIAATNVASGLDEIKIRAKGFVDGWGAIFSSFDASKPFMFDTDKFQARWGKAVDDLNNGMTNAEKTREQLLADIMAEREKDIAKAEQQRAQAKQLREEYDKLKNAESAFRSLKGEADKGLVGKDELAAAKENLVAIRESSKQAADARANIAQAWDKVIELQRNADDNMLKALKAGGSVGAALAEQNAQVARARANLKSLQAAYKDFLNNDMGDRLERYKRQGNSPAAKTAAELAEARKALREFERAQNEMDPQRKVDEEYNHRQDLIDRFVNHASLRYKQLSDLNLALLAKESNALGQRGDRLLDQLEREADQKREHWDSELTDLRKSLRTEEEEIIDSYRLREEFVQRQVGAPGEQSYDRDNLLAQIRKKREKELQVARDAKLSNFDSLTSSLLTEEEAIKRSYDRRKKDILQYEGDISVDKAELNKRAEKMYIRDMAAYEGQRREEAFNSATMMFSNLASVAEQASGKQSASYKMLFALSKGFALATAAVKVQQSIAESLTFGWPQALATAAFGTQIISTIMGTKFSGAYDKGGSIPAGRFGLVGEYGPEFVRGPATVTSRKDTAAALSGGGGGGASVNLRIINPTSQEGARAYMASAAGERVVVNYLQKNKNTLLALSNQAVGRRTG